MTLVILAPQFAWAGSFMQNLWNKKEIVTCFAPAEKVPRKINNPTPMKVRDWSPENREKVERWANEEFSPERTGIYFTGFKDCAETPEADLIFFYNKTTRFSLFMEGGFSGSAIGLGPKPGSVDGYPHAKTLVAISSPTLNKEVLIHELGHVVGLAHEHNHPQASRKDCKMVWPHRNPFLEYTEYDAKSIMSYCTVDKGGVGELSEGDLKLIRRLYLREASQLSQEAP